MLCPVTSGSAGFLDSRLGNHFHLAGWFGGMAELTRAGSWAHRACQGPRAHACPLALPRGGKGTCAGKVGPLCPSASPDGAGVSTCRCLDFSAPEGCSSQTHPGDPPQKPCNPPGQQPHGCPARAPCPGARPGGGLSSGVLVSVSSARGRPASLQTAPSSDLWPDSSFTPRVLKTALGRWWG